MTRSTRRLSFAAMLLAAVLGATACTPSVSSATAPSSETVSSVEPSSEASSSEEPATSETPSTEESSTVPPQVSDDLVLTVKDNVVVSSSTGISFDSLKFYFSLTYKGKNAPQLLTANNLVATVNGEDLGAGYLPDAEKKETTAEVTAQFLNPSANVLSKPVTFTVTFDYPPVLVLKGKDGSVLFDTSKDGLEGGTFNQDVTISWTDKDIKEVVLYKGHDALDVKNGDTFTENGSYSINATDDFGNGINLTFTIAK